MDPTDSSALDLPPSVPTLGTETNASAKRRSTVLALPGSLRRGSYNRHLLEAATGLDCRGFFRDRRLQPLAAAAQLEEMLEAGHLARLTPGVRYFFGHRIPG